MNDDRSFFVDPRGEAGPKRLRHPAPVIGMAVTRSVVGHRRGRAAFP
jgi:hypothetical protein